MALIGALCFLPTVPVLTADTTIMTIGDTLTKGLPTGDGISYHTYLDSNLTTPAIYVGNPADGVCDSGAAIVGGSNHVTTGEATLGGGTNATVFPSNHLLDSFHAIKDSVATPDYVVILAGTYDLIELIAPLDTNDTFVPSASRNFNTAGVFTDDGTTSYDVDPLIDRYEALLDAVAEQFPSSEIICLAPVPSNSTGAYGGEGSQFHRARFSLGLNLGALEANIMNLVATKGEQFSYLDADVSVAQIIDGLHPNPSGYNKIGTALANFINANSAPQLDPIGPQSVDEETLLAFDATASDPDGDSFTFSLGGNVPAGATITPGGEFTWTPPEDLTESTYTFQVVVRDNGPNTLGASETITVTVNEVNAPPSIAAIPNQTVDELAPLSLAASGTDTDIPANTLTFSLMDPPAGATITPGGHFAWTPAESQGGATYTITVVVTDDGPGQLTDSTTFDVIVNEVNHPPVLDAIGTQSIDEGSTLTFTATATDFDVPAHGLTFTLEGNLPAGATMNPNGSFSWTPMETQGPDTYTVDVVVTDDGPGSETDRETITITVNEVATEPVLASIGDQMATELVPFAFTATATDADIPAEGLAFSLSANAPAGASISGNGAFTWTPSEDQGGDSYTFDVIVTDDSASASSDSETITVTVADVNVAPVLDFIGDQKVELLTSLHFTATASDADLPTDTLAFSLEGDVPQGASITSEGVFSWKLLPSQGVGTYTFDVVVTDDGEGALSDRETIAVEVNYFYTIMTLGDSLTTGLPTDGMSYHSFIDANLPEPATYLGSPSDDASDSGAIMVGGPGRYINRSPVVGEGRVSAVFPANGIQESFEAVMDTVEQPEFAIVLAGLNDLMQLIAPRQVTDSFTPMIASDFTSGGTFTDADGLGNAQDHPVDPLIDRYESLLDALAAKFPPSTEIIALPLPPIDPEETFDAQFDRAKATLATTIPAFNAQIEALIASKGLQFSFVDHGLTVADIVDGIHPTVAGYEQIGTALASFITANNAPVLDPIGDRLTDEQTLLTFTATASDPDAGQALTFSLAGDVPEGAIINGGGDFSWTPSAAQSPGIYTFTVVVTDDGPGTFSAAEVITVTVDEDNVPPVLDPIGPQTVDEHTLLSFTATATDDDGDPLTFRLEGDVPTGAAISATGAFTFTPTEDQGGQSFSIDVVVDDGGVLEPADRETVTITVAESNSAPILDPVGNFSTPDETLLTFTATGSDANDTPANNVSFSLSGAPVGATISPTGTFNWTPTAAQGSKLHTFDVVLTDDGVPPLSASETITVTVGNVNAPPTLSAIGDRQIDETTTLAFTAIANDNDSDDTLTFSIEGSLPPGASFNAAGAFEWTPTESQGGTVFTFTIVVTDNGNPNLSDSEEITVAAIDFNAPPVLDPIGNQIAGLDETLTFVATAMDTDLPADALTFSLAGNVPNGATISSNGVFNWLPSASREEGNYTFDVVVTDNGAGTLTDSETIIAVIGEPVTIMTIGDSTTSGLPHNDGKSYHLFIDHNLPAPAVYIGDPDSQADSGALMVGGDGRFLSQSAQVGGPPVTSVFAADGVQQIFAEIKDGLVALDYITVMIGLNDMMQLAAPRNLLHSFAPSIAGDVTSGGTYTHSDGMNSQDFAVDPMIERYEAFLNDLHVAFPSTTILCLGLPPVDPNKSFDDQFDRAKATLANAVPAFNSQVQALVESKGSPFDFLELGLTVDDLRDGLHPSDAGHEKIGQAIAAYINDAGNGSGTLPQAWLDWQSDQFAAADLNDPSKEATVWGRRADPDGDGWANEFEFYLLQDALAADEPIFAGEIDGAVFRITFTKRADAPLGWVPMEYSPDMNTWFRSPITLTPGTIDGAAQAVEASIPLNDAIRLFVRFATGG